MRSLAAAAILLAGAGAYVASAWNGRGDTFKLLGSSSSAPASRHETGKQPAEFARQSDQSVEIPVRRAEAMEGLTVIGVMRTNGNFDDPMIASFSTSGDFDFQVLVGSGVADLARGGFSDGEGHYYALASRQIVKFDTSSWNLSDAERTDFDLSDCGFPKTATYDMSSGTAYGCFEDELYAWEPTYSLCSFDVTTGKVTKLISLPGGNSGVAYGLAADARGNIYAILKYDEKNPSSYYPALYKADLSSKKLEYVGNTGVNLSGYYTGAACDPDTGKLYFMADAANKAALYELDTTTGEGSLVLQMPNNEQFSGIYIPRTSTSADAPAMLKDLAVDYSDAQGHGTLSFTVPEVTYGGSALEGSVAFIATCGDWVLASGTRQPGEKVTAGVTVPGAGAATVKVKLTSAGHSSESALETWVGNDTPLAPTNVTASATGNDVTIRWDAPTKGIHGGYLDADALRYDVTIQPVGTKVADQVSATECTATLSLAEPQNLTAEVTATAAGLVSQPAESAKFVAGAAFALPYRQTFDSPEALDLFTIADLHGDGATWHVYKGDTEAYAQCEYHDKNPKDDWLFTPALHLEKGHQYSLSFQASCLMVRSFEEILEVKAGKTATPEGMTITILEPEKINNPMSWSWYDYSFILTVEEDGDYHIGFHAMSEPAQFRLALDNLLIEGASLDAPVAPSELTAKGMAGGEHKATVSFRAPEAANNGTALGELEAAYIYVNNRLAYTFENPAPGAILSAEVETEEGSNEIDVYAANAAGRSMAAHTTVYTGKDVPAAPGNFTAKVTPEGVVLSWDEPEGLHGGTVDPAECVYYIGRYVNGEIDIVAYGLTGTTTVVDNYSADYQTVVTYGISASNPLGDSPTGMSNSIIVGGEALTLPFRETFASGFVSSLWQNQVVDMQGVGSWRTYDPELDTNVQPVDDDYGCIVFHPNAVGDKTRLFSGLISLVPSSHPVLEFWYRGNGSDGQVVLVEANKGMTDWETIGTITLEGSNVWKCAKIALDDFKDCDSFQIAFQGNAKNLNYIYIDDITIRDVRQHDLAVALTTRKNFHYGTPETLEAAVTNMGEKASGGFTVEFYADGKLLDSRQKPGLDPDETAYISLEHSVGLGAEDESELVAKVVYDADEYLDNNTSSKQTRNHLPLYPAPRDFRPVGESNGSFAWTEPEEWVVPDLKAVTDDFEGYEPFIIDEIGDWTVVDEDGADGTFGILGLHFPFRQAAKSWQVFNLRALGLTPAEDDTSWDGHSGNSFLIAFADLDRKNDDWLISPILSGDAQTISFWAKSINTFWYGNETYEVLASSTGKELSDFKVVTSGEVDMEWTGIRVKLPAGTKYFAIKCTSEDKYIMCLDDITYIPGVDMPDDFSLVGYNVYRDGKKVNDKVLDTTAFSCEASLNETFAATAVYTTGESRFSNLYTTSVGSVAEELPAEVAVEGKDIVVRGAEGLEVSIVAADGVTLYNGVPSSTLVCKAASGVHAVRVDGKAVKVIVK